MSTDIWQKLTALSVSELMSFEKENSSWRYQPDRNTMADKQAEGVAHLWNTLGKEKVAILADEVGMGKTFQAIGLIRHMWLKKPDAKVLVIAPNRNICNHWRREFRSFSNHHFHFAKKEVVLPKPVTNLTNLVDSLAEESVNIFFTTVHSFSGLTRDYDGSNKAEEAERVGGALNQKTLDHIGTDGFDLLVVDEAHYFRTIWGGSQKVAAAKAFFGSSENKLAQRVLLMTATPTHSSPRDVNNILSYFCDSQLLSPNGKHRGAQCLLSQYALRRFRLMKGRDERHYTKYDYREESELPVDFENNPDAELFFGLYQRRLVHKLREERKKGNANKQYLYGYLEGFESFGEIDMPSLNEHKDDESEAEKTKDAFRKASDSELLYQLSKQYHECLKKYPQHPKYNALVKQFTPHSLSPEVLENIKHLVFVRRIPSVRELTKRVNAAYDDLLAPKIAKAVGFSARQTRKWEKSGWNRELFNQWQRTSDEFGYEHEDDTEIVQDDQRVTSKVANLFVVKKGTGEKNTLCTNVGLRFKKSESIFSLFLEPGSDHLGGAYEYYLEQTIGGKVRAVYSTAAYQFRMRNYLAQDKQSDGESKPINVATVWGDIIPLLAKRNFMKLKAWHNTDRRIVENFANYLKAGLLFASPVMVELFIWFIGFSKTKKYRGSAERRYKQFLIYVKPKLKDSCLLWYFNAAIETFEEVCEKIEGVSPDDYKHKWSSLKSLGSPAAFASGESGNRERLILGFNSPFYPNVLVATSVFQEGVNLHMQCNNVHHYGLAGNPGDNEQRVGRVDRLYGKVNRLLQQGDNGRLNINFPYLENSFDEDQLASFLEKKYVAEEKLDTCLEVKSDNTIDSNKAQNWQSYLKKPKREEEDKPVIDPYPAIDVV